MGLFDIFKGYKSDIENYNVLFQPQWRYRLEFLQSIKEKGEKIWSDFGRPDDVCIKNFDNVNELNKFLEEFGIMTRELNTPKIINPYQRDLYRYLQFESLDKKRKISSKRIREIFAKLLKENHISFIHA